MTEEPALPVFRTPEDVAPELGMTPTELRRYCRESGIHTRLSNRRIMLHQDDIKAIVEWVRTRPKEKSKWSPEENSDPFA